MRNFHTLTDAMWARAVSRSRWTRNEVLIKLRAKIDPKKIYILQWKVSGSRPTKGL